MEEKIKSFNNALGVSVVIEICVRYFYNARIFYNVLVCTKLLYIKTLR